MKSRITDTPSAVVRAAPRSTVRPQGLERLPPKAAGELEENLGLIVTVAARAFVILRWDTVRPQRVDELLGFAAIVMDNLRKKHEPARGRFSTFAMRYGASHIVRLWRTLEGGQLAAHAEGKRREGKRSVHFRFVKVGLSIGTGAERKWDRGDDRPGPLEQAIANEEAALNREIAGEWLEDVPGLEVMRLHQAGVSFQVQGGVLGVSRQRMAERVKQAMAEVEKRKPRRTDDDDAKAGVADDLAGAAGRTAETGGAGVGGQGHVGRTRRKVA